jgi:hypothetical protein
MCVGMGVGVGIDVNCGDGSVTYLAIGTAALVREVLGVRHRA